jgi:glutamate racemase
MSWITITKETLYDAKIAALIDACDTAATASSQSEGRAASIIQGVVNEIRNAVATCKGNQVDADTATIPESLRDLAVDLVMARLKGALEMELTQDERDTITERRRQLRDIAACNLVVDQPDNAVVPEIQAGGASQIVSKSSRPLSGDKLKGL